MTRAELRTRIWIAWWFEHFTVAERVEHDRLVPLYR